LTESGGLTKISAEAGDSTNGSIMDKTSSPTSPADELILVLSDPAHLFNAPPINPLSSSAAEVLGVSGVEYLLNLLHMDKVRQRARTLVLSLPPEKAVSAIAEPTMRALHHYAEARIDKERRELRNTYRYGWKVTSVAVLLLAICLALSSLFASEVTEGMRPLLRKTLEYGFEIVGWVMLWHPIEVLGFTPLSLRSRITALQTLASIDVAIRADRRALANVGFVALEKGAAPA
jgi:hypothetical protein